MPGTVQALAFSKDHSKVPAFWEPQCAENLKEDAYISSTVQGGWGRANPDLSPVSSSETPGSPGLRQPPPLPPSSSV